MAKPDTEKLTRALLQRMGSHERSWAYATTLARATGGALDATLASLAALEREGLAISEQAPTGPRYRLSERGVEVRDRLRGGAQEGDQ